MILMDIKGEKDYFKLLTVKMLKTGKGQCHSMPLMYLMIAETLEAEAWLAGPGAFPLSNSRIPPEPANIWNH